MINHFIKTFFLIGFLVFATLSGALAQNATQRMFQDKSYFEQQGTGRATVKNRNDDSKLEERSSEFLYDEILNAQNNFVNVVNSIDENSISDQLAIKNPFIINLGVEIIRGSVLAGLELYLLPESKYNVAFINKLDKKTDEEQNYSFFVQERTENGEEAIPTFEFLLGQRPKVSERFENFFAHPVNDIFDNPYYAFEEYKIPFWFQEDVTDLLGLVERERADNQKSDKVLKMLAEMNKEQAVAQQKDFIMQKIEGTRNFLEKVRSFSAEDRFNEDMLILRELVYRSAVALGRIYPTKQQRNLEDSKLDPKNQIKFVAQEFQTLLEKTKEFTADFANSVSLKSAQNDRITQQKMLVELQKMNRLIRQTTLSLERRTPEIKETDNAIYYLRAYREAYFADSYALYLSAENQFLSHQETMKNLDPALFSKMQAAFLNIKENFKTPYPPEQMVQTMPNFLKNVSVIMAGTNRFSKGIQ